MQDTQMKNEEEVKNPKGSSADQLMKEKTSKLMGGPPARFGKRPAAPAKKVA